MFAICSRYAVCLGLAICLSGCGEGRTVAPVSGKVTLAGKPLADVRVLFQPAAADAKAEVDAMGSYATTDAEGNFTLRLSDTDEPGALVGQHRVMISDKTTEDDTDGGPTPIKKSRVPNRYSDGSVTFEVKPEGTDQANFDLTSK